MENEKRCYVMTENGVICSESAELTIEDANKLRLQLKDHNPSLGLKEMDSEKSQRWNAFINRPILPDKDKLHGTVA